MTVATGVFGIILEEPLSTGVEHVTNNDKTQMELGDSSWPSIWKPLPGTITQLAPQRHLALQKTLSVTCLVLFVVCRC